MAVNLVEQFSECLQNYTCDESQQLCDVINNRVLPMFKVDYGEHGDITEQLQSCEKVIFKQMEILFQDLTVPTNTPKIPWSSQSITNIFQILINESQKVENQLLKILLSQPSQKKLYSLVRYIFMYKKSRKLIVIISYLQNIQKISNFFGRIVLDLVKKN